MPIRGWRGYSSKALAQNEILAESQIDFKNLCGGPTPARARGKDAGGF